MIAQSSSRGPEEKVEKGRGLFENRDMWKGGTAMQLFIPYHNQIRKKYCRKALQQQAEERPLLSESRVSLWSCQRGPAGRTRIWR